MASMTPAEKLQTPMSLPGIMRYFAYDNAAQFRADWAKMTAGDKAQIKDGLSNGTFTY